MKSKSEELLQSKIFPELEKGRPNWDRPHTEAVVRYIKQIIEANPGLRLDPDVLIPAAYAHDWGYSGLFKAGKAVSFAENADKKETHMQLGAKKIAGLLGSPEFDYLSNEQKGRIVHLVSIHDKVKQLKANDELVLMEADTLGVADPSAAKPTHTKEEYTRWRELTERERIPRFITDYSKIKIRELLELRGKYYETHKL